LQSIDGKTITLNDFKGKKVMLNFWISTCGACDSEMGYIQEIYRKYPKNEVAILAINGREDATTVSSYAQRKGLSFTILLDPEGRVDQIYQPELFPYTFFVDTNGIIREVKSEAFTSSDEIQSILDAID
jgi:peroxiredoxin